MYSRCWYLLNQDWGRILLFTVTIFFRDGYQWRYETFRRKVGACSFPISPVSIFPTINTVIWFVTNNVLDSSNHTIESSFSQHHWHMSQEIVVNRPCVLLAILEIIKINKAKLKNNAMMHHQKPIYIIVYNCHVVGIITG